MTFQIRLVIVTLILLVSPSGCGPERALDDVGVVDADSDMRDPDAAEVEVDAAPVFDAEPESDLTGPPDAPSGDTLVDGDADTFDEFVPPPELVLLMDHDLWEEVPLSEDPYADHQPEEILCNPEAIYLEERTLEVDTGLCNYVSLRQPMVEAVEVGDTIEIAYWHGPLISAEIAEAHTAIMLGDEVLWERTIAIPHPGNFFFEEIQLRHHIPAGTRLLFHLHNHGINSWMLAYVAKFTPGE